jgi:beta-lactamase class A
MKKSEGFLCVFLGIILFVYANIFSQTKANTPEDRLKNEIMWFEEITGGSVGVGSIHLESGRSFFYNENTRYPMASTYKIAIAVQLLSLVEKGEIQLSDMIELKETDLHPGSGIISSLLDDPGVILSLHNLLELMLLISDNSAADLCMKQAGGSAAVTQKMREIGITDMDINRPTYVLIADYLGMKTFTEVKDYIDEELDDQLEKLSEEERETASDAFNQDLQDTATPAAMATLLKKIWEGEILNDENTNLLIDIMKRCETGEARIKGMLPEETVVYHKTGTIGQTINDVGIVQLPWNAGNIVAVVFIKEAEIDHEQSEKIIAEIARSLYDYYLFTDE